MSDGFRAHDPKYGPKLAQSQAAGLSRLARFAEDRQAERVEAARARLRAELLARRPLSEVVGPVFDELAGLTPPVTHGDASDGSSIDRYTLANQREQFVAERGTDEGAASVKAGSRLLPQKKRGAGRPAVVVGEPWVAEGVSRRTWYRRKKGKEQGKA